MDISKLRLLKSTAEDMARMSSSDLNLVLYEAGLGQVPGNWHEDQYNGETSDEDRKEMAQFILRDCSLAQITELATALQQVFDAEQEHLIPAEPEPLILFASHLSSQRKFIKEIATALEQLNVSLFVAHSDIPVDSEWHAAIESSLQRADAGVVFLQPSFIESSWCDQEVGWLLGRGVPVFPLKFAHQDPYGPLGKKQARPVSAASTAGTVAEFIMEWIATKPALGAHLNASLVIALQESHSYALTDRIWKYLSSANELTSQQVAIMTTAFRDNDQVYGAACKVQGPDYNSWYPEIILDKIMQQPGYEDNQELVLEAAKLRGLEAKMEHSAAADSWNSPGNDPPF